MNLLLASSPRIFVLEPDDDVRPLLKYNLQAWGYRVVIAFDETDAMQRTQGKQNRFDLILINQAEQTIGQCMLVGCQIRASTEHDRHIPILIMAERYGSDLEGQDIQVGDHEYVSYLEDGQQLKVMLQRLCPVY
jgi:CheY-like chemotaxis protein